LRIIWDAAEAPEALEIPPQALVAALREKLGTLDAADLVALEAPLAECLEALRAARRKALEQGA
jgi:hypothetical protein